VNAHGYLRFTMDVDVVLQLDVGNIANAFAALGALRYRPSVPVTERQFADPAQRAAWTREKNMTVLQFWSDAHRETSIDVFVSEPFEFDVEYDKALRRELAPGLEVRFTSLQTLIAMKQRAGRPQDLLDVENLQIRALQQGEDPREGEGERDGRA